MPIVGQLHIPDNFFQILVKSSEVSFLTDIFGIDGEDFHLPLPEKVKDFVKDFHSQYPSDPTRHLISYVRIVLCDFIRSDHDIQHDANYVLIDHMIDALAKQHVYELLGPDGVLIKEADRFFQELDLNPHASTSTAIFY